MIRRWSEPARELSCDLALNHTPARAEFVKSYTALQQAQRERFLVFQRVALRSDRSRLHTRQQCLAQGIMGFVQHSGCSLQTQAAQHIGNHSGIGVVAAFHITGVLQGMQCIQLTLRRGLGHGGQGQRGGARVKAAIRSPPGCDRGRPV